MAETFWDIERKIQQVLSNPLKPDLAVAVKVWVKRISASGANWVISDSASNSPSCATVTSWPLKHDTDEILSVACREGGGQTNEYLQSVLVGGQRYSTPFYFTANDVSFDFPSSTEITTISGSRQRGSQYYHSLTLFDACVGISLIDAGNFDVSSMIDCNDGYWQDESKKWTLGSAVAGACSGGAIGSVLPGFGTIMGVTAGFIGGLLAGRTSTEYLKNESRRKIKEYLSGFSGDMYVSFCGHLKRDYKK